MNLTTFAIYDVVDGTCTCSSGSECGSPGRHPKVKWSKLPKGSTTDEIQHGIVTGEPSGIFVVDLDIKDGKNGVMALERLGQVPETYIVATPTGGYHLYFKWPGYQIKNSVGLLGPGVDIRGDGGMVVGPGSKHRNGGTYEVIDDREPVDAPQWLLDRIAQVGMTKKSETITDTVDLNSDKGKWHLSQYIEELKELPPSVEGQGGSLQLWIAAEKGVRTYNLPLPAVEEAIKEHFNPRCNPSWSDQEIWHKLENARDNGTWMVDAVPGPDFMSEMKEVAKPKALQRLAKGPVTRKVRNPSHEYDFKITETTIDIGADLKTKSIIELIHALSRKSAWLGVWQYNEFSQSVFAVDPPIALDAETEGLSPSDVTAVRAWFAKNDIDAKKEEVRDAIIVAAKGNRFHPVREYLESLTPTDPTILDDLATRLFGAETEIENTFFKKFLVAAVRRILEPGCKMDAMLILHGVQGAYKSTTCQILFGPWYRAQMPELHGRDGSHALEGYWGIELAEMDRIVRAETTTTKEFLSRSTDTYRKYGNGDKAEYKRQCVFIGTTNRDDFLNDETGNRRFWPINVIGKIDKVWLEENRDKIWSAALQLALTDYPHWLDAEDEEKAEIGRKRFIDVDPWHEMIKNYCAGKEWIPKPSEIFIEIFGQDEALRMTKRETNRIGATLRRLGCYRTQIIQDGVRLNVWKTSPKLAAEKPNSEEVKRRAARETVEKLKHMSKN